MKRDGGILVEVHITKWEKPIWKDSVCSKK